MASRAKPSSREASVPVDTVRKERIIGTSIAASLARGGRIVIRREAFSNRFGPDFSVQPPSPQQDSCRTFG
jgi:hypothetical protein